MSHYPYAAQSTRNRVGLVALILTIIGAALAVFVFAVPALLFLSIPVLIAAFIVAIVGLTRRGQSKATSVIALVLSVVFGIVGPVLFAGSFVSYVANGGNAGETGGTGTEESVGIGETVVNADGVEFTVTGVECGVQSIVGAYGAEATPQGAYCVVSAHVKNGSSREVTVSVNDVTGLIGSSEYAADFTGSQIGGQNGLANVNPGIEIDATFAVDVPADAALEFVKLGTAWSFADEVVIDVRQ